MTRRHGNADFRSAQRPAGPRRRRPQPSGWLPSRRVPLNSLWWNPGERRERRGARLTRHAREEPPPENWPGCISTETQRRTKGSGVVQPGCIAGRARTGRNAHNRVLPPTPPAWKGGAGTHVGKTRRHRRWFRAPARADRRSAFPCGRHHLDRCGAPARGCIFTSTGPPGFHHRRKARWISDARTTARGTNAARRNPSSVGPTG